MLNWKYALKRNKSRISRMCLCNFICAQARSRVHVSIKY